jgi:predicted amidophosphoribosyltransferase
MSFIETQLGVSLPRVEIKKNCGTIAVPQQSLMNVDERIRNAGNIFAVSERRKFNHLLLIDDDAASGSTLNQLAAKIKDKGIARTVSGLAIICSTEYFVTYQPDQQKVS